MPFIQLKFRGEVVTALIVCNEKIRADFKKVGENSRYIVWCDQWGNLPSDYCLYATEKGA